MAKKILVIDDEPSVVTYLTTLLQDNGYETVSAADGTEGLEKAKAEKPDLVTLDITMPKESGIGLYRKLRGDPDLKDIKVVVVTAVTGFGGSPEDFERFLKTRKNVPPPRRLRGQALRGGRAPRGDREALVAAPRQGPAPAPALAPASPPPSSSPHLSSPPYGVRMSTVSMDSGG